MLSLLKPMSVHVGIDLPSTGLWMNYLNGEDKQLAIRFAAKIHNLVSLYLKVIYLTKSNHYLRENKASHILVYACIF
jgi:hypothetical protein